MDILLCSLLFGEGEVLMRSDGEHQIDQLPLTEDNREALKSLLREFGIDERFTAYRGVVDYLLLLIRQVGDVPENIQYYWEQGAALMEQLAPHMRKLPAGSPNFVYDYKKEYPILSAIYADPGPSDKRKMNFLKYLLLSSVFIHHFGGKGSQREIYGAANEIRLGHSNEGRKGVLPNDKEWLFTEGEIRRLYRYIINLNKSKLRSVEKNFVKSIEFLSSYILQSSSQVLEKPPPYWLDEDEDAELPGGGEKLAQVDLEEKVELLQLEEGAPEPELDQTVIEGEAETGELSEADLRHRGRLAHFLGRQWRAPYPWGRGGVNPLDEPFLASLLQDLPDLVEGRKEPEVGLVSALLLALVAATSRDLDELLEWDVASEGSLHPEGFWQRQVVLPQGAYSQPADPKEHFLPVGRELSLPLPPPIPQLLEMLLPSKYQASSLGTLLGLDKGSQKAQRSVRERLNKLLASYVREPVSLENIRPWARNRVHLKLGCEVRTYCLFGDLKWTPIPGPVEK